MTILSPISGGSGRLQNCIWRATLIPALWLCVIEYLVAAHVVNVYFFLGPKVVDTQCHVCAMQSLKSKFEENVQKDFIIYVG